ncbi:MAG: tyrosine-type recombinase/integrase [Chloroflexi bacterium]|nr:tyrosine-type recombinase/integrase [Chloroflexota bacterium]
MKLKNAVDLFLLSYQNPDTRKSHRIVLSHMLKHLDGYLEVDRLRPADLVEYAAVLDTCDTWSPATRRKYQKNVKTFFNWLVKIEEIDRSPARNVIRAKSLPAYISRDKAISDDELETMLTWSQFHPRHDALFKLLRDSGCRIGGAAGLRVDDIDFERNVAFVTEKGDKSRLIAFGVECANAIRVWLLQRRAGAGPVVFSITGRPIKAASLAQLVSAAAKKLGLRALGPHHFRHRKGHQLADAKVAPSIAATALGHSGPDITLKHYYPADWETAEQHLRALTQADEARQPKQVLKLPIDNRRKAGG